MFDTPPPPSMQASRGSVVIVEDDTGLNHAVARLLRIAGFESTGFDSAEHFLANAHALNVDCFVFDLHLPGMSGLELQQRLDEQGIARPVIFITAHDDLQTRQAAGIGISCLLKPFTGKALLQAVDAALTMAEMR